MVNNNAPTSGIGLEVGAENMNIYHNTVMSQWPTAGYGFIGTVGGYMQDNYACMIPPTGGKKAYFGDSNGPTTVTYRGNQTAGYCPRGLASLAISLGSVTNTGGTLTATATVTTVEYGMQGVVFAIDGHYVSAVMGGGPYKLNCGAARSAQWRTHGYRNGGGRGRRSRGIGETKRVDASRVGPSGPIAPNVDPAKQDFDIAGNAERPDQWQAVKRGLKSPAS